MVKDTATRRKATIPAMPKGLRHNFPWDHEAKFRAAKECVSSVAARARKDLSEEARIEFARRLLIAAYRFSVTGSMSSDISAKRFRDALESLLANLRRAQHIAWDISAMISPTLMVDGEAADYMNEGQRRIAESISTFLARPEISSHCSINMFETLTALASACDGHLADLNRLDAAPIRGKEKQQHSSERQRFLSELATIYEDISDRRAKASDGTGGEAEVQSGFTLFVAAAFKIAGNPDAPKAHAINTALKMSEKFKD